MWNDFAALYCANEEKNQFVLERINISFRKKRVSLDARRDKERAPKGCCTIVLRPAGALYLVKYSAKITRFYLILPPPKHTLPS